MINAKLVNSKSGNDIRIEGKPDYPDILVSENIGRIRGAFKSAARSTAGTSTITSPTGNGSIVLTDLMWATDKVNSATITIQFNDGSTQEVIFSADVTDFSTYGSVAFQGNWQGWKGASLELVTTGTVEARVSCGYYKVSEDNSLEYSAWDALR